MIVGIAINIGIPILTLIGFFSSKNAMLFLFLNEDSEPATIKLAWQLLLISILGQIADGLRNSSSGILRGLGDTSYAFRVMFSTVVGLMLPFSVVAQFALNWGPVGILAGRNIGILAGALLISRKAFQKFLPFSQPAPEAPLEHEFRNPPRGCLQRIRETLFGRRLLNIQQPGAQPQIELGY